MTWTAPPTFTNGAVLTAAQLNILRDDLNETAPAKATTQGSLFVATGANAIAERIPSVALTVTSETTASTSYVDLATAGPAVTVTTGVSALLILTAQISNGTINGQAYMGFEISGSTVLAASSNTALIQTSSTVGAEVRASATKFVTGLTAGSNTFTAKYRAAGGTATFRVRELSVIPF